MKKALLLLVLPLLLLSCTESAKNGFIMHNVNGYTLNTEGDLVQFDAIAVLDGKVTATGTLEEVESENMGEFDRIDGSGKTLLPGLIDAHTHVMGLGVQE